MRLSLSPEVVAVLRDSPAADVRLADGATAQRVGRNAVWQITAADGDQVFARVCRDDADFARQVFGLRLAERMAAADARFMAAALLTADAGTRLLVTRPIGGTSVSTIFANAHRLDRNPLARPATLAASRDALRKIAAWLTVFHQQPIDAGVPLYDHSRVAVWQRTARKLDALSAAAPSLAAYAGFSTRWRLTAPLAAEGLVFGDATMGNFFVDGERVGAVDLEDVGRGATARDWATLQDDVTRAFGHAHYRTDRRLLQQVDLEPDVTRELVLLELAVNRLEHVLTLAGVAAAYSRRRIRRRIDALVAALAAGGAITARTA